MLTEVASKRLLSQATAHFQPEGLCCECAEPFGFDETINVVVYPHGRTVEVYGCHHRCGRSRVLKLPITHQSPPVAYPIGVPDGEGSTIGYLCVNLFPGTDRIEMTGTQTVDSWERQAMVLDKPHPDLTLRQVGVYRIAPDGSRIVTSLPELGCVSITEFHPGLALAFADRCLVVSLNRMHVGELSLPDGAKRLHRAMVGGDALVGWARTQPDQRLRQFLDSRQ